MVGRPIAPGADVADVLAAIEAVYPAIEVVDSRYAEPFRLADSVADNAGAARVVLGDGPQARRARGPARAGLRVRLPRRVRHRRGRRGDGASGRRGGLAGGRARRSRRPARARRDRAHRRAHRRGAAAARAIGSSPSSTGSNRSRCTVAEANRGIENEITILPDGMRRHRGRRRDAAARAGSGRAAVPGRAASAAAAASASCTCWRARCATSARSPTACCPTTSASRASA